MPAIVSIRNLQKTYANGFSALKGVNLDIEEGEILALLGPNGAGKTTMISIICGISMPTGGTVMVGGHDVVRDFRQTRKLIGLVPQELTTDQFETVWNTVSFSRGLHGEKANPKLIEQILKDLSLWDKRDNKLRELSGGMKRRVLIAKALAHEPRILFLDEPTAGVDVELRRGMWAAIDRLREGGVTVILTTHYIEEAEEMADRIGVISGGELLLVEEKRALMQKLGRKQLRLELKSPLSALPPSLEALQLNLSEDGRAVIHEYGNGAGEARIGAVLAAMESEGLMISDISTHQSRLKISSFRSWEIAHELEAIKSIYLFEMARMKRTLLQSVISPVITTSLYFIVFGTAIGTRIQEVNGVSYGAFITPGLIMLTLLGQCISNGAIGIYFPKFTGTIYEILSAPVSMTEVVIGYVGAAASKGIIIGLIILATASFFVDLSIQHPVMMLVFMVLTAITFSMAGFIIGIWADNFEQLNLVPMLVVPPLTFLGGSFYSIDMLPPFWQTVSHFNPVLYLVSGFRWSFYGIADVNPVISLVMIAVFLTICLSLLFWIFRTGYRCGNNSRPTIFSRASGADLSASEVSRGWRGNSCPEGFAPGGPVPPPALAGFAGRLAQCRHYPDGRGLPWLDHLRSSRGCEIELRGVKADCLRIAP